MTAVPRLYEVLHDRILNGINAKGGMSKKLFMAAIRIGTKRLRGEPIGILDRMLDRLLDRTVRTKVRARLGGRLLHIGWRCAQSSDWRVLHGARCAAIAGLWSD